MAANCKPVGLNCFTSIGPDYEDRDKLIAEVEDYFELYNLLDPEISGMKPWWDLSKNQALYYVVYFPDASTRDSAYYNSNRIKKPDCIDFMSIHGENQPCSPSPGKRQKIGDGYTTPRLSEASDKNIRNLDALRTFGESEKKKYDDKLGWFLRWSSQFAVLLVLPMEEYQKLSETDNFSLPRNILEKYAKFAIPSSHTDHLDDLLEQERKVIHAEAKLMGDPLRSPINLSIPYKRSWLMRIITDHEMAQWEKGNSSQATKYKVFLYSAIEICYFCKRAILRSIFVNLASKGKIDDETKPVIGHSFENKSENELTTDPDESKVIFYLPERPLITPHKKSDNQNGFEHAVPTADKGPKDIKRDLGHEM
uniref:uncharacterized protein LOC120330172 n=1 Tax=Styela clava TaxID=7725 RepID=UPI00193A2810|nr:uncharacterized protein LOC120330172 [Styela clava]XP_039252962.1 uncharacterized protein LOC120330172 [Styela clava]